MPIRIVDDVEVALAAKLFPGVRDRTRLALLLAPAGGERRVTDLVAEVGGSQVKSGRALADHDVVDHDEFAELVGEDGCRLSYQVQMLTPPPMGRVKSATVVPSV